MCGIVGLMFKRSEHRSRLGQQVLPMLDCMAERGPDSAGLALFSEPVATNLRRFSLFSYEGETDWLALQGAIEQELHRDGQINPQGDRASLISGVAPAQLRQWLSERAPGVRIFSVGRSLEVFKNAGNACDIARRYNFQSFSGSHCIGHTRMATESRVSPMHAHPFTAGEDFCLVHNGSLSNYHMIRRRLEIEGVNFETDNDSEAACRFLQWRVSCGDSLERAIEVGFSELDGFYTFLIATSDEITLVRDGFACKPAVVAETDQYVAISSEFRSMAHLPGIQEAALFEPLPERIYSWKVTQ
jgi:methylamine---glutamate N-methyltransferase subunit A